MNKYVRLKVLKIVYKSNMFKIAKYRLLTFIFLLFNFTTQAISEIKILNLEMIELGPNNTNFSEVELEKI